MSKDKQTKTRPPTKPRSSAKRGEPNEPSALDRMRDLTRRVVAVPKAELPPNTKRAQSH